MDGPEEHRVVRVGLVVDGSESYGLHSYLATLAGALDRRRVRVVGVFLGSGAVRDAVAGECDEVCDLGVGSLLPLTIPGRGRLYLPNLLNKGRRFLAATLAAAGAVRHHRLDLLHVHTYPLHYLAGLACRLAPAACLWHWHGPFDKAGVSARLARWGFGLLATRIACISRFVKETLPPEGRAKADVCYNSVPVDRILDGQSPGHLRRMVSLDQDVPLVGVFGALSPRKGHEYFLRAAARVAGEIPEAHFIIVGDTNPWLEARFRRREVLTDLARELSLAERVHFAGTIPEAWRYMRDCDVVCMPTIPTGLDPGEGFGLSMAEAMAAGVAVVATNCGAPPEVIEDGVSGLLRDPRQTEALAGAIQSLLGDRARRQAMGAAGARRIREAFDTPRMARRMEQIYRQCIARPQQANATGQST